MHVACTGTPPKVPLTHRPTDADFYGSRQSNINFMSEEVITASHPVNHIDYQYYGDMGWLAGGRMEWD